MLFKSKPHLYLRFYDKSIHYLAMDLQKKKVVEKGELLFDTTILLDGKVNNWSLIQTRLDALTKEKKWQRAKVSIILPDDFVTIRHEEIPVQLNQTEAKDYIDLHINQSIRLPFDNPKVDFEVVSKNEETQTVLLVAYPGEEIRIYLDLLEEVGLKPEVADVSALSVYRVVKATQMIKGKSDNHLLLLQWNPIDMSITVFNKDIPQFNRHTRLKRLADAWSLKDNGEWEWLDSDERLEDNITEQLNGLERFLEFYRYSVLNGEDSVSSIILTGSFPNLDQLKKMIQDRFSLDVYTLKVPQDLSSADSSLYGLFLKEDKAKNKNLQLKSPLPPFKKKNQETVIEEGEG